jgi:mannose-1-phosphate guanylyltransferase/mannose-6-phosphate isomerase
MLVHPVVLAGGAGTRLWPISRNDYPKQYWPLTREGTTLFQQALKRLDGYANAAPPVIICSETHRFLVSSQVRQLGKSPAVTLLESITRGTAPALTLAALWLREHEQNSMMLVMPADHVVKDASAFHAAVEQGVSLAQSGRLVTFGVPPTCATTAYGYIRPGQGQTVAEFVEKPDLQRARRYFESGHYLWNSGIFLMSVSIWLKELERYHPDIANVCKDAYQRGQRDGDFYRVDPQLFLACPSDSIDYAVMEKTGRASVVPLSTGWADLGDWSALYEASAQDHHGNVTEGDVALHKTTNSLVIAQHRLLAAVGLDDMIVVETPDVVLVTRKDHTQDVKALVNRLEQESRYECQNHRKVYKPWGHYEVIDCGDRFKVKRITVNPGAALSLQMHHQRSEHWVVVRGEARVTCADEVFTVSENQSTYIPVGVTHRLENPGSVDLKIIEVQSGNYLGEDDIVRFDDRYDRIR